MYERRTIAGIEWLVIGPRELRTADGRFRVWGSTDRGKSWSMSIDGKAFGTRQQSLILAANYLAEKIGLREVIKPRSIIGQAEAALGRDDLTNTLNVTEQQLAAWMAGAAVPLSALALLDERLDERGREMADARRNVRLAMREALSHGARRG